MSLNVLRAFSSVHLLLWPGEKNAARDRFHPRLGLNGEPPAIIFILSLEVNLVVVHYEFTDRPARPCCLLAYCRLCYPRKSAYPGRDRA